jgi:hypothetical protein
MKKLIKGGISILIFILSISFTWGQDGDSTIVFKKNGVTFFEGYFELKNGTVIYPYNGDILEGKIDSLKKEVALFEESIESLMMEIKALKSREEKDAPDTLFIRGKGIEIIKEK